MYDIKTCMDMGLVPMDMGLVSMDMGLVILVLLCICDIGSYCHIVDIVYILQMQGIKEKQNKN